MRAWIPLLIALLLNAAANVFMKVGSRTEVPVPADASLLARALTFMNVATVIGVVLFAANVLVYRKALDRLDVSLAYPIMVSGGMIIIAVAAALLPVLHERISMVRIAGMVVTAIGVWIVARS
jgi:multidrug transporter EmrE-like cation transporter